MVCLVPPPASVTDVRAWWASLKFVRKTCLSAMQSQRLTANQNWCGGTMKRTVDSGSGVWVRNCLRFCVRNVFCASSVSLLAAVAVDDDTLSVVDPSPSPSPVPFNRALSTPIIPCHLPPARSSAGTSPAVVMELSVGKGDQRTQLNANERTQSRPPTGLL